MTNFSSRYHHHDHTDQRTTTDDPDRAKQEFLAESNVNTMMAKYGKTGIGPPQGTRPPMYGDFSDPALTNYQGALNQVQGVGDLMMRLPAKVRARFANNPANLILFVQDPKNIEQAYELGLLRDSYESPNAPNIQFGPGETVKVQTLENEPKKKPGETVKVQTLENETKKP